MRTSTDNLQSLLESGLAWRALPGQDVCGDLYLIQPIDDGVLLAVVDGLGHGNEAVSAANTAVAILKQHADEPLITLVRRCHEALTKTRGAVLTVAQLRSPDDRLTWLGVGNVEAALLRAGNQTKAPTERVLLRS